MRWEMRSKMDSTLILFFIYYLKGKSKFPNALKLHVMYSLSVISVFIQIGLIL